MRTRRSILRDVGDRRRCRRGAQGRPRGAAKGRDATQAVRFRGVVFPSESHATLYEFSEAELQAAVEEAKARGTYVMAHVYTDEGVRRCLRAGVRSIEHANFVGRETVAMMAERGVYFDPTFISLVQRIESAGQTRLPDR